MNDSFEMKTGMGGGADNAETISAETIAVLGAQGRFGQSLCARLAEMRGDSSVVIPTADKMSNKEIAARSDVVMITVRPDQVGPLLHEISDRPDRLKPTARIVSFAARYPLTELASITKRPSARIMADPSWNISAYALGEGFSERDFSALFAGLTKIKPISLKSDTDINKFSVLLSYLLVVLILKKAGALDNSDKHLGYIADELSKLGSDIKLSDFGQFETEGDSAEALKELATPGGITEKVIRGINQSDINPGELYLSILQSEGLV